MAHSANDLFEIVYGYYPRAIPRQDTRYEQTAQYARLYAARRKAGAEHLPWRALLRRLHAQFASDTVQNLSLHLPTGNYDAGYSGNIFLPTSPGEHFHCVGFAISFLAPYYFLHTSRIVDDLEAKNNRRPRQHRSVFVGDTCIVLPAKADDAAVEEEAEVPRKEVLGFEFSPDEEPYATHIAKEIEATWGYKPLPPEIGKVVVPDVATNLRMLGEATLYDCLMSEL